jgi:hypothetical protein
MQIIGAIMSDASFESIPVELFDLIAGSLAINNVCALRLVSRSISTRASKNGAFPSCFEDIHLEPNRRKLEGLATITSNPQLAQLVQSLTIVGRSYINDRDDLTAEEKRAYEASHDVLQLTKLFSNLAYCPGYELRSISIAVVAYTYDTRGPLGPSVFWLVNDQPSHTALFQACGETLSCIMQALNTTSLSVRSMNLFTSESTKLTVKLSTGLPSRLLDPAQWKQIGSQALVSLRSLHLRIMDEPVAEFQPAEPDETRWKKIKDSMSLAGLVKFLKVCPNLEELRLFPYTIREYKGVNAHLNLDDIKFKNTTRVDTLDPLLSLKLPSLRVLDLAGFVLNSDRFRDFLERHAATLRRLRLFHVVFRGWPNVSWLFPLLTSDAFALESILLTDLNDGRPIVFLRGEGQNLTKIISDGWLEGSAISQWGSSAKEAIAFTHRLEKSMHIDRTQSCPSRIRAKFGCLPWYYWKEP